MKTIYLSSFGHTINYAFLGIIFRLGIEWFEKRDKQKELEKQNIKTELALLRAQINPHFLFNTLNNINSFAQTNSDKTSYAIIKLSSIMRYMLYEANAEKVFLVNEIQYIQNYIDLQKLRYKNPNFIELKTSGINSKIQIPPMLFIPFIENVFKHGKKSEDEKIEIRIEVNEHEINFFCKNTKRVLNETEKISNAGIGIANIKRRLEILFPANNKLDIFENEKHYIVNLKIENYEN
ncbi:MAG: histidine kinase [Weeksellaceae bacterium]|nr:histidine kinase [Weeksellaceae bacterium]